MDAWSAFGTSIGLAPPRGPRPVLSFEIQGRPAVLQESWLLADSQARSVRLSVDLRGLSPGTLKILPEGFLFPIARLFGAQDLKIGDRTFDALYVVKASPPTLAAELFAGPRRARLIETLRAVGRYNQPLVDLSRDRLRVQTTDFDVTRALLERLTAAAHELTGAILELPSASMILWDDPTPSGRARCPVCAAPLRAAVTACRSCRTPHHHECWIYAGGCATYACELRARRN